MTAPNRQGNPYRCADDERKYLRTSGLMLYRILEAYDGRLPRNAHAVFANTGNEHNATLRFVQRMQEQWHVPITWVEYVYDKHARGGIAHPKNTFRIVDFRTASRRGEPFEMLIRAHKMLPNAARRLCTSDLKVETAARFARVKLRWRRPRPHSVLGIRYDEPGRWAKAIWEQCRTVYPLVDDHVTENDVDDFWARQPFDLGISHERPLEADTTHHPVPRARRLVDRAGTLPAIGQPQHPQARAHPLPRPTHLRGPQSHPDDDALRRTPRRRRGARQALRLLLLRRLMRQ